MVKIQILCRADLIRETHPIIYNKPTKFWERGEQRVQSWGRHQQGGQVSNKICEILRSTGSENPACQVKFTRLETTFSHSFPQLPRVGSEYPVLSFGI